MKNYRIIIKNSSKTEQIKNSNWPKRYRSEFIEPGICSYEDVGAGIIFIGSDTLDKMNPSFIGKPVINGVHQDLTAEEAFKLSNEDLESLADGVIYEVGKLPNGWYYCDMIIWDEETQKNIEENDYSVSCAYIVDDVGKKGTYHEIPYDEEILEGTYTHNAIVESPRYEGAKVYELPSDYQNSRADEVCEILKNSKGETMKSKIFKHLLNSVKNKCGSKKKNIKKNAEEDIKKDPEKEEDDDEMMNMEGAMIDVEGEKIPLDEAVNAYKSMKDNQDDDEEVENLLNAEDEVDVDGEKVNVSDLIAAYQTRKQNAEQAQDVEAEEVVEEQDTVQNSKKKEKSKHFKMVKNAVQKTQKQKIYVNTTDERFQRGKDRYGSKKKEVAA